MIFFLLACSFPFAASQSPTATAPLIINQGPLNRCYGWYGEPTSNGYPSTSEQNCAGSNMYGRFTLGTYGWKYPSEYQTSLGYEGSVIGTNGSPLNVSLTNNAKNSDCSRALEVNLSFDYPGSALYSNVSTTDLAAYDSIIIEYDVTITSATTSTANCVCKANGQSTCPSYWKSQLTTDILFYQGANPQNFNAISVRHFDPQNYPTFTWSTSDGYRVQYTDHQIPSTSPASAYVKLDVKHLIHKYSNQLCQGGGVRGPIYMRAIQLVSIATGADMTFNIANIKANAFKYAPGAFSSTAVTPGPTATNCPQTTTASALPPTQTLYGQCGGINWTGPKTCSAGTTCQYQNDCELI